MVLQAKECRVQREQAGRCCAALINSKHPYLEMTETQANTDLFNLLYCMLSVNCQRFVRTCAVVDILPWYRTD